ncbi:hypothetical protein Erwinia_phage_Calisson_00001 [Erwinia phage Calisson]|nr:hypothetical protein Erwinia_phage_Calisson_00001 [Erwinia phage Calisson]
MQTFVMLLMEVVVQALFTSTTWNKEVMNGSSSVNNMILPAQQLVVS